jgi:Carboxypeptidase regulatory-like domain
MIAAFALAAAVMRRRSRPWTVAAAVLVAASVSAQHASFRMKGRVKTDGGEPIANAEVRAEAFYGYAAGTFSGQRTFVATTGAKGDWSIAALQPGVWLFEAMAPGYLPETVILPPRLLTTVSQGTSGMSLTWDLILKPLRIPDNEFGVVLKGANDAVAAGRPEAARDALRVVPEDMDADGLAGAARIAIAARDMALANTLFRRALERDPSSYRAALGVASLFLYQRDFDSASRAFDAARSRTHDKEEQRFISAAIGELAAIKYR